MKRKAVILLSGGLDSAVTLFLALKKGYEPGCLFFDYGQRHKARELDKARRLARYAGCRLKIVKIDLGWKGSSLLDMAEGVPIGRSADEIAKSKIPSTYVPARNTIFLSMAASYAEAIGADRVFIGAHFEDSSGYPDCGARYLKTFDRLIRIGTKRGLEKHLRLEFPLVDKTKREIIKIGNKLGVPFRFTWSCYRGGKRPCMRCDSCILRAKGFREAGLKDPS